MNFYRQLVLVEATFTRPANTTTYAAGDVMGTATVTVNILTNAARLNAGAGFISSMVVISSANPALNLDADVFIFNTAPAEQADNDAFAATDAEMNECCGVGSIVGTDGKESTVNVAYNVIMPSPGKIDFVCDSGSRNLFAVMVARNAYVPASGEIFLIRTWINQA